MHGTELLTVTDQRSEDEEHHEEATEDRCAEDITVANCRHRDQREVDAFPVCQSLIVLEVVERIARVFHLYTQKTRDVSHIKYNEEIK